MGIQGNELADSEAKAAIRKDVLYHSIPVSDMKPVIKGYIRNKWQRRWTSQLMPNNKKYKSIRNSVSSWPSSYQRDRRVEVVLTRLRIGHTYLTHRFLLEGSDAPECAQCGTTLSVEHILVRCPQYNAARRKYGLAGKPIQNVLNDDADIEALVKFLKEINIYNKL